MGKGCIGPGLRYCMIFLLLAGAVGCASGPAKSGDTAPLVDTAAAIVFSYELAKQPPAPEDNRPLSNTEWEVKSITPKPEKAYTKIVLFFQPGGDLVETTTYVDGSVKKETSRYHVVGSTMIINKSNNDVNARFRIEGDDSLIMDTGDSGMLLKKVR